MSAPDFRSLGKRGGMVTASTRDMRQVAAHARRNAPNYLDPYWFDRVDPDRRLAPEDRKIRARNAQRLFFSDIRRGKKPNTTKGAPPSSEGALVNTDTAEQTRHVEQS